MKYLDNLFDLLGLLLNLLLAYQFLHLWISPDVNDIKDVYYLAILMGFEFIMVHSGVFMASMPVLVSIFVFVPVYGVFALIFTSMVGDNSILVLYLSVVFNRMRYAFVNVGIDKRKELMGFSALVVMIYFLLLLAVVILSPLIPKLGLSDNFLILAHYSDVKMHGGLLTDMPEVAMCFGALYYLMLSLLDVFRMKISVNR